MNALESSSNTSPTASPTTPPTEGADDPPSPLRAALAENKLRLLTALREAGVHCATISYFGEGDSGSIQHVDVSGADGSKPDVSRHCVIYLHCNGWFLRGQWTSETRTEELRLEDALRAFADDAVTLHHDGYENNDGGSGEVIFDCVAGTVRLEHVNYYTESDCTDTDL